MSTVLTAASLITPALKKEPYIEAILKILALVNSRLSPAPTNELLNKRAAVNTVDTVFSIYSQSQGKD